MCQHGFRNQRARIKAYRTRSDEVAPAQGQEIRRAGTSSYEMNCHVVGPIAIAQVANRSVETARGPISLAFAPAAAQAVASATLPVP